MASPQKIILNWSLRLLAFVVIVLAICAFMLNIISGTGEPQRRGLEQAFTDGFGAPVTIGTLKSFNILPQFIIEAESFKIGTAQNSYYLMADNAIIAFSFFDLLLNKKTFQNLELSNAEFLIPQISPHEFKNARIFILRPEPSQKAALFMNAQFEGQEIIAKLTLEHSFKNLTYNYYLSEKETLNLESNGCMLSADFYPHKKPHLIWSIAGTQNPACTTLIKNFMK